MTILSIPKPLGLFGGRFDPVHRAHVAMAQAAADQLNLDEIRWIVTGSPIHKPAAAASEHRLRMTGLALEELGDTRMRLDDREIRADALGQTNATYKTIESFLHDDPDRPLIWILGEDQFTHFTGWQHWEWLIQNMTLAVCARPGSDETPDERMLRERGAKVLRFFMPLDALSSTHIRQSIAKGVLPPNMLPRSVADYISEHALYR